MSMSCVDKRRESLIKNSLSAFMQKAMPGGDSLSDIDDIVLHYMASVLEDLGEANYEDNFDLEQFIEMMGAYFPGFVDIDGTEVYNWLFSLAKAQSNVNSTTESSGVDLADLSDDRSSVARQNESPALESSFIHLYLTNQEQTPIADSSRKQCENHTRSPTYTKKNLRKSHSLVGREHKSSLSDRDDYDDEDYSEVEDKGVELLQEMFPNVCVLEVTQCLSIASGDTEHAAQLIMHRLENREGITTTTSLQSVRKKLRNSHQDDKQLKEHILSRYAYVDEADDERDHKPAPPKAEPKKLIRYRDNKIVSIKGERYSEIKKDDE